MTTCLSSYSQETRHEISMSVWDSIKSFDWTIVIKCFCLFQCLNLLITHRIFRRALDLLTNEQSTRIIFNSLEGSYALCLLGNIFFRFVIINIFLLLAMPDFSWRKKWKFTCNCSSIFKNYFNELVFFSLLFSKPC